MWSLEHRSGQFFHINKREIEIGRNLSSDLCLTPDQSVSRHHAKIVVSISNQTSKSQSNNCSENDTVKNYVCQIIDHGSRFSTYIIRDEEIKLTPTKSYQLKPGDKIKFGTGHNIWTLKYIKIGILSCGDDHNNKKKIAKAIEDIGGTIFNKCNPECTHYMTMCNRITPKFIFSVCYGLPITGKNYWEDFVNSVNKNQKLPDVNDYIITNTCLPPEYIDAPLYPTSDRRRLFRGFNFIFFSPNQCNNYGLVIKTAGGKLYLYHKFTFNIEELVEPNMIVIECSENDRKRYPEIISSTEYNAMQICLKERSRRMVPCIEITSAILFCSIEKFCNPTTKRCNKFWQNSPLKKQKLKAKENREGHQKNGIDQVENTINQKENKPIYKKIINDQINVTPKKLPLQLSESDTTVSERRWITVKTTQKTGEQSQLSQSMSNVREKNVNTNNNPDEISEENKSGKTSSKNKVFKDLNDTIKKSSQDIQLNKTHQNKRKEPDLEIRSGNSSSKNTSEVPDNFNKKSSKESGVVTKLKKEDPNQVNKNVVGNHSEDERGKSSNKTILQVSQNSNKKSSKDSEDVTKLKKKDLTQVNKSGAGNHNEDQSGKSSKTISEVSQNSNKKSSKNSEDVTKLKKKDLNQDKNSGAGNHNEDESGKSSTKTIPKVPEDSTKISSKDSENEKLKKRPNTQPITENCHTKKFENILGVLDDPKKKLSKNKNVEKSSEQFNSDDKKAEEDLNHGKKLGIKVVSDFILTGESSKNLAKIVHVPDEMPSKSNEDVEKSNEKHLDQDKELVAENHHEDKLENIAQVSDDDSNRKSSQSKEEDDRLNRKYDSDDVTSLDGSFHSQSQRLDNDDFEIDKKSKKSVQIKNPNMEAGSSNEDLEIANISSSSDKSEINDKNRKRISLTILKGPPPKKRYNLRSQRLTPDKVNTKVNSQAGLQVEYLDNLLTLTPLKSINDIRVSETINDKTFVGDQELSRDENDDANLDDPLEIDNQNEGVENCEQFSQIYFQESQQNHNVCEIVNVDVHANPDSFTAVDDFESAILQSQVDNDDIVKENNIKPDYKLDDSNTLSSNKLPHFFFKNKKRN